MAMIITMAWEHIMAQPVKTDQEQVQLSEQHVVAINRPRRIIANFDVIHGDPTFTQRSVVELVKHRFTFIDDPSIQIDSVWWNWGEGNQAPYPSKILPIYDHPGYRAWVDAGTDIVQIFLDETRNRGKEAFFTHRMNGSDNDLGPVTRIPAKREHPDWLFRTHWAQTDTAYNGYWNFKLDAVHDHVLKTLREVAERYEFDGIELDFARGVVLPAGEQWENRHHVTEFVRKVRLMLLDVERKRGWPFLLAVRVPENLIGCHFDGLDVETWARQQLVDLFVIGCRSLEADVYAFKRITVGTPIKVYPAFDDHHSSDGYMWPPIEVFRGVLSNWLYQGANGVQTFNFAYADNDLHRQVYQELSQQPDHWSFVDKHFVIQRRGGGHGASIISNPEDWSTPRTGFANSNMLSQIPLKLNNDVKADTLLNIFIGDDLDASADRINRITLRLLLNDPATKELSDEERISKALIRHFRQVDFLYNSPPAKGIEDRIELLLNNCPLAKPAVADDGWLVFVVRPAQIARGQNLIGVKLAEPRSNNPALTRQ